jgi:hypothetical protein
MTHHCCSFLQKFTSSDLKTDTKICTVLGKNNHLILHNHCLIIQDSNTLKHLNPGIGL